MEKTENLSSRAFLEQFNLFVRSMGIHHKMPYLYPMYGAADIAQVYSRIGAVYGGHFVLDKEMKVSDIDLNREKLDLTEKTGAKNVKEGDTFPKESSSKINKKNVLTLKKGEETMRVGFDKLICGPEYSEPVRKVMGKEAESKSVRVMQTIHLVLKCDLSIEAEAIPCTIVYPEGDKSLKNENVIRVNVLGWNSKSTPLEFVYLHISCEKWEALDLNVIKTEIVNDVAKLVKRKLTPQYHFVNERIYK